MNDVETSCPLDRHLMLWISESMRCEYGRR